MTRFLTGSSGEVAADELVLLPLLVDPDADVVELTTGRRYLAWLHKASDHYHNPNNLFLGQTTRSTGNTWIDTLRP